MRKISDKLWEEFSNTTFEEQEKILSRARDLLLFLDVRFDDEVDDDDRETFFVGSMALENAMRLLKEKKLELFEEFINETPEVHKLWEEFNAMADEMEKECGDWQELPDTEADKKLRERIMAEVQNIGQQE